MLEKWVEGDWPRTEFLVHSNVGTIKKHRQCGSHGDICGQEEQQARENSLPEKAGNQRGTKRLPFLEALTLNIQGKISFSG